MTQTGPDHLPRSEREDRLLAGRVRLLQPREGYRAGMDAVLLAAACDATDGQRVADLGCGAGAVLLSAAVRLEQTHFVGIERDGDTALLASQNIILNGLQHRASVVQADVAGRFAKLGLEPFDAVLCNPPYFDDPAAMRAPHPARAGAYLADDGLEAWTGFLQKAVREGGSITVIHRADRLVELLSLLGAGAGSLRVRPIHPFADAPAKRVIVRAIKTGKAPLALLPPLILHDRSGAKHTSEAEALLRGEAVLTW